MAHGQAGSSSKSTIYVSPSKEVAAFPVYSEFSTPAAAGRQENPFLQNTRGTGKVFPKTCADDIRDES